MTHDSPVRDLDRRMRVGEDVNHDFPMRIVSITGLRLWAVGLLAVVGVFGEAEAREARHLEAWPVPGLGQATDDRPEALSGAQQRAAGDTLYFGYLDGEGFAIEGDAWTFDHGGADPFEGWTALDVTEQSADYGRQITSTIWDADPFNIVAAPVLNGQGSAWIGAFAGEANALCWDAGLGFGNSWCQRLVSPILTRDGSSDVDLTWLHFNDTEPDFDYVDVYLELLPSEDVVELRKYTDQIGLAPNHPTDPPVGANDGVVLSSAEFAGATDFRIVFEMTSDSSWSDEDGLFTTEYGAMSVDDLLVAESPGGLVLGSYGFETGLEGWTAEGCPGFGALVGIAPLSDYVIEDACDCDLAGNVLELHDDAGEHPDGQRVLVTSPPVNVLRDVAPIFTGPGALQIFAEWDQYSEMPRDNCVLYRPGWQYYPYVCESTGEIGWSPRVGQSSFYFVGVDPACSLFRNVGTGADEPVPPDAEQVRFIYELVATADAFGFPGECTGETNFTPIIDNLQIGFTETPNAPPVLFELGHAFQDGFAQNTIVNDPHMPGRADIYRNIGGFQNFEPLVLGDSLQISGPPVTTADSRWEARLWFRVPRVGPGADARYTSWRDRAADGSAIDPDVAGPGNPIEFAWGLMDSVQLGTNTYRHKFCSYFREDDDDFDFGAPELSDRNEILADDVFFPGTQVQYFVSTNYLNNPSEYFLVPDTTGGFFREFEILPGWRDVEGVWKYPCFLYVDAYNLGAEAIIEDALDQVGIVHDRFDYLFGGFVQPPMRRGSRPGDNNGCTLAQLLGYRGLLVNIGVGAGEFWPEDYELFSDYLTAELCGGDRRGLLFNGSNPTLWMERAGAALLPNRLGAEARSTSYRTYSGDDAYCVLLEAPAAGGELYGTSHTGDDYVYSVYGNGCPDETNFDVLGPVGTGVGNRVYVSQGNGTETAYAQIVNESDGPTSYRTVLDGTSWHVLAGRDQPGDCDVSGAARVQAAYDEIRAAVEWIYGDVPSLCEDPCGDLDLSDASGGTRWTDGATRLQPSTPNPFNPRTTLRYSLAADGPVVLAIFDAGGRRVRTLAQGIESAGMHELIWDGADDRGTRVASGVYWVRLEANGQRFASRLVRVG